MKRRLIYALDMALIVLFVALVCDVVWQVASRYLLASPSGFTEEAARFLLIWLGLLGGCRAAFQGLHTAVTTLQDRLPQALVPWSARLVAASTTVFAVAVFLVGGGNLVRISWQLGQRSAALGIPLAVVYLVLPIAGVLLIVAAWSSVDSPDGELEPSIDGSPREAV